jgi:hypothetical protein
MNRQDVEGNSCDLIDVLFWHLAWRTTESNGKSSFTILVVLAKISTCYISKKHYCLKQLSQFLCCGDHFYFVSVCCRAGTHTCRTLFSVDSGYRMTDNQWVTVLPVLQSFVISLFLRNSCLVEYNGRDSWVHFVAGESEKYWTQRFDAK